MENTKTIKRFVVGFYSGESYDIVGHGKTLNEALIDLRMENMARAAQFEADESLKQFENRYVIIDKDRLLKSALFFGKSYEKNSRFFCQEITEHFYDVENQLSKIIDEKYIGLKYPLKWV